MSAPERIGKYRVVEPIGRGGMGSVYKAHDPLLDRMVAIKVMAEDAEAGTEARERFLREAQSAARLNHPNIITVFELGEDQGRVFIVMELLEGHPLSRLIARVPPLPLRRRLDVMAQICEGLAFAHKRGVVHRDIKPANIFVLENWQAKILDFGIARVSSSELTRTGLLMGTPNYMSPEQARGRRTDARSDIFSVGVVFYELLSGRKPFIGEDYFETLEKVRSENPPPLEEVVPGLPPALVSVVQRALAKDPAARYQTLEDMKLDLMTVPELLPPETSAAEDLREGVDRKFAELLRLHRKLVAAVGSAALGDETLPLADPASSGMGLETVLRDLEVRTDRLRALARTVEGVEPGVSRGVAAFERGAFGEAIAELDRVLEVVPLHQRARDYRERARLEEMRERTVKAAGPGARGGGSIREVDPAERVTAPLLQPTGTAVPTEVARTATAARSRLVLGGVGAVAVVAGGLYLFWPTPPAPSTPAPRVLPAPAPAPAPPPASPLPQGGAPSPAPPKAEPGPVTPKPPGPAPKAPAPKAPAPKPPPKLTAEQVRVVEDALTLAQLFLARGDSERAIREYQKVLVLDPNHAEAREGVTKAKEQSKSKQ